MDDGDNGREGWRRGRRERERGIKGEREEGRNEEREGGREKGEGKEGVRGGKDQGMRGGRKGEKEKEMDRGRVGGRDGECIYACMTTKVVIMLTVYIAHGISMPSQEIIKTLTKFIGSLFKGIVMLLVNNHSLYPHFPPHGQ